MSDKIPHPTTLFAELCHNGIRFRETPGRQRSAVKLAAPQPIYPRAIPLAQEQDAGPGGLSPSRSVLSDELTLSKHSPNLLAMPRVPAQLSFTDSRERTGRGGPRPGAGRPRGPRPRVLHRGREAVPGSCPVHVTLRVRPGVASLRSGALVREWRRSLAEASERGSFRVAHYSLQGDHAHLIVEAQGKDALACGMKSIGARLARGVDP